MQPSNWTCAFHWGCCLFNSVYFWPLYLKAIQNKTNKNKTGIHSCVDICLGFQFDSIHQCVCFYDNTMLIYCYNSVVQFEVRDIVTSRGLLLFMIALAILLLLLFTCVYMKLKIILSSYVKNYVEFWCRFIESMDCFP